MEVTDDRLDTIGSEELDFGSQESRIHPDPGSHSNTEKLGSILTDKSVLDENNIINEVDCENDRAPTTLEGEKSHEFDKIKGKQQ